MGHMVLTYRQVASFLLLPEHTELGAEAGLETAASAGAARVSEDCRRLPPPGGAAIGRRCRESDSRRPSGSETRKEGGSFPVGSWPRAELSCLAQGFSMGT